MKYRLGLDIGTNSIGWSMLELNEQNEPINVTDNGVRIFTDGREEKTKIPLAVKRRDLRGARRRRDRYLTRRAELIKCLINSGLFPNKEEERLELKNINPYLIRKKALDEKVEIYYFGRALFHINQRRGFKSNRKELKKNETESKGLKGGINKLKEKFKNEGFRTYGEFLYSINESYFTDKVNEQYKIKPLRLKPNSEKGYDYYPERAMLEDEFNIIWAKQQEFHCDLLNNELKEKIFNIIFFQRPLKKPEIGKCTFENGEERAALALPLVQSFRILQQVNNLKIRDINFKTIDLNAIQRGKIIRALLANRKLSFDKIRKLLEIDSTNSFNLETEKVKELKGDLTSVQLSADDCFGNYWWTGFSDDQRNNLVQILIDEEDEETLIHYLCVNFNIDLIKAKNIVNINLAEGYGRLSKKALEKIVPYLEAGLIYNEACDKAGYDHSLYDEGKELLSSLPYYGEILQGSVIGGTFDAKDKVFPEVFYGKINNPTVHIALNQLRKIINALLIRHGRPSQIVIELARELKLSINDVKEIEKEQKKNQDAIDRIKKDIESLGLSANRDNINKFKVWESLSSDPTKRLCPFSGETIGMADLFSNKFEIEHILPFSKTFDDGINNKVISSTKANRDKGNRSPYEAFGHNPTGYNWDEILLRADNLPYPKKIKFSPDAMNNLLDADTWLKRQLTDTQYMSRMALKYLKNICDQNEVWSVPGRLTAMLRGKWGLNKVLNNGDNEKNRADHRHHAIDAFVIACTSRSMLQKISSASNNIEKHHKLIENMPLPFEGFTNENYKDKVNKIIVSLRPDHGDIKEAIKKNSTIGPLHLETAYGLASFESKGVSKFVSSYTLDSLKEKDVCNIVDTKIRNDLTQFIEEKRFNKDTIREYSKTNNVYRVRLFCPMNYSSLIGIKDKTGKEYKFYELRGNYCTDIYEVKFEKEKGKWKSETIPLYYAHKKDFVPVWKKEYPTAKLIMRLFNNDTVAYEESGKTFVCKVKKMTQGKIYLRPINVSKEKADDLSWCAFPNSLKEKKARRLFIDELGYIKDYKRDNEKPYCGNL